MAGYDLRSGVSCGTGTMPSIGSIRGVKPSEVTSLAKASASAAGRVMSTRFLEFVIPILEELRRGFFLEPQTDFASQFKTIFGRRPALLLIPVFTVGRDQTGAQPQLP